MAAGKNPAGKVLSQYKHRVEAAIPERFKAIIPIDDVCRDYFYHLTPTKLVRKISRGDIPLPLVRIEESQRCAKGIHLADLAKYLELPAEAARKEMRGLSG